MTKYKRGSARQEQILLVANRLFREQGYTATSMRQIADEAGLGAVSGLYNHFPNKEAIFEALLISRSPYEELLAAFQAVEGDTLAAFLRSWFAVIDPVADEHLDFIQLVLIDMQEFNGQKLAGFLQEFLPHYFGVFSQLVTLPDVRRDLPLPILVRTIASAMIGAIFTKQVALALGDSPPIPLEMGEVWLDGLTDILARGLSALPDDAAPDFIAGEAHI